MIEQPAGLTLIDALQKPAGLTLIDALLGVAIVGVNIQYRDALLVGFLVFGAGRLWSALASSPP